MDNIDSTSPDGFATVALDKISDLTADAISFVEDSTRKSPLKAISCAVAVGYLLRQLPIFALFGVFFRLALLLVRPAVLIFGGLKAYRYLSEQPSSKATE